MDEQELKNSLSDGSGYVEFGFHPNRVLLDGHFRVSDLEKLVAFMKEKGFDG